MSVSYTRVGWQDAPSTDTPIDAANLNHMDNGILALSEEVDTELPLLQEQINDISTGIDAQIDEKVPPEVSSWLTEHVDPAGSAVVVDDSLTIEGAAADAKKTGDEISDLKDGLTTISDGEAFLTPYLALDGVIYSTAGNVQAYPNAVTYVYMLKSGKEYTVTEKSETFCVYGLSNTLYSGTAFATAVKYNDQSSNTNTFVNADGYKYLYITKNNGTVDRTVSLTTPFVNVVLSDHGASALSVATEHFNILATSASSKTANYYVKSTDGTLVNTSGFNATDYIDIKSISEVVLLMPVLTGSSTHAGCAFYNDNKQYLSGIECNVSTSGGSETRIISIPSNAAYMRTTCRAAVWDDFFVRVDDVYCNTAKIKKVNETISEMQNQASDYGMQLFEKIGVIGDSISVGWALDKNGNNSRRNTGISWVQQMARRLGCTAYNLGASGVDPVEWFQSSYEFAEYCYTQYQQVGFCDLYIVGLGLNPTSSIGSTSDINQSDYTQNAETFYGQYARIIQMINSEHPNAIVMCLTEPTTNISNYDIAVRNICGLSYINAELVDLDANYRSLFTTAEIEAEKQPDSLHYTPHGYSLIADAMVAALNDYIAKNPTHFKYVGVQIV